MITRDFENPTFAFNGIPPACEIRIEAISGTNFGVSSVTIEPGEKAFVQVELKAARVVRLTGFKDSQAPKNTRLMLSADGLNWKRWTAQGIQASQEEPSFLVPEEFSFWRIETLGIGGVSWDHMLHGEFNGGTEAPSMISLAEK